MFEFADEILDQYAELIAVAQPSGSSLQGQVAAGRVADIVAVDSNGSALLLVATRSRRAEELPRSFESLTILPPAEYEVSLPSGAARGVYSAIVLPRASREMLAAFTLVSAGLLATLPESPTPRQVQDFLDGFIDLFRSGPALDPDRLKGLWGELWLIYQANSPAMLHAWNSSSSVRFDFAFGHMNVEVKTHEGAQPSHFFSHDQLVSEAHRTIVVSLRVREEASGSSVTSLVNSIAATLGVADRTLLLRKALVTAGTSVELLSDIRYLIDGEGNARGVYANMIPSVEVPKGAGIDRVSYRVNIAEVLAKHGMTIAEVMNLAIPVSED